MPKQAAKAPAKAVPKPKTKKDEKKVTKKVTEKPKVKVAAKPAPAKGKDTKKTTAKPVVKAKAGKATKQVPKDAKKTQPKKKVEKRKKTKEEKTLDVASQIKEHQCIKRPRHFHIGGDLPPPRDLSRMVKWPRYIRLQRMKKIMYTRLKIPAMINQFTSTLSKQNAKKVFSLIKKYRPETETQKKKRLLAMAKAKKQKKTVKQQKPFVVKFGVNHVASLVEQKKARLVVIANDVDPIEHVLWLPTLCRKMDVPYCIVKNKARLGRAVHLKTATCLAFVNVRPADKHELTKVNAMCRANYNNKAEQIARAVGGGKLGLRSSIALKKRAEALKKASLDKHKA
ncbi:putative 60S ribosomal protein L7a [Monocercomonoides exilis]|uniref:putative 60S ribosomal protein L7a n=1 Tax=Monocercomonoides exilis TaxID=2049356 RepID=UPI00355942F8|nr:putative 60S ribosomal protein L7a [Monocercomonoides exilis]|eukprot:MONOS_3019.1-p1 / transcript=MONOS_3019.1 / gene=MONOS_3019 / organism=Monocercomonoides_exilis_PA203 / gene_product=60S ribosomal protein L7a / transcript_product=60S ribosomal protein L7a / location=Mono_scaffold00067:33639-34658(+) / protein_length=340 / sequence_SO=supercontig / SO=protein_coding / is_pseudo=false